MRLEQTRERYFANAPAVGLFVLLNAFGVGKFLNQTTDFVAQLGVGRHIAEFRRIIAARLWFRSRVVLRGRTAGTLGRFFVRFSASTGSELPDRVRAIAPSGATLLAPRKLVFARPACRLKHYRAASTLHWPAHAADELTNVSSSNCDNRILLNSQPKRVGVVFNELKLFVVECD